MPSSKPEYYEPTDEDREMLEDITYELEQMRLAQSAGAQLGWDDPRSWLLAEAGFIHARALMEFLFYSSFEARENQSVLARATWYTTRAWRPAERRVEFENRIGRSVHDAKKSIDLRICHLAVNRRDIASPDLEQVVEGLNYMWELMRAHLRVEWKDRFPA